MNTNITQTQHFTLNNVAATQAFTAVNVFDYLGNRADAETVLDLFADRLTNFISCGADISEVTPDDLNFIVSMSAPCHTEDCGIGAYEYWGTCGVDHNYQLTLDDECAFGIDLNETALAAAGLSAAASDGSDVEWEDNYDGCGTARCDETVTVYVTDPAKFEAWLSAAPSTRKAA